jgi:hypothetical protein
MATLDVTAFDYALKTLYTKETIENLVYEDQPWLALIPKWERFRGKNFVEALVYTNTGGEGHNFAVAQRNKLGAQGKAFTITRKKDYGLASIDGETIEASEGDEGALLEAIEQEMDSALHGLRRRMGIHLYGDGSSTVGTISTIAANLITLSDAEDVTNFDDGQRIVAAANATSAPRAGGTAAEVTAVDRDAGTVTIASTPAGWVANDLLFREGDYEAASDSNSIAGMQSWIPDSAPTATLFFGVDRSVDTSRLGGNRLSGAGLPLTEALTKLFTRICREGGRPDCAFISFARWEELENLLGSKVKYSDHEVGDIGFQAIRLRTPKGPVDIFADINMTSTRCYGVQKNVWKFRSLGGAPRVLGADGQRWLREPTADAYEVRTGYYGNVSCRAPGYNGVCTSFGS